MVIIELDSCGIPGYGVLEVEGYIGFKAIGNTATREGRKHEGKWKVCVIVKY